MTGISMLHVPYRGKAPSLSDLLGGRVQVIFGSMHALIEHFRTSTLRPLAVTTALRSETLPNIPTVGESVPGYEASAWYGIGAPKNTPVEIIEKLNSEFNAALADPKTRARLADLGGNRACGLVDRLRKADRRGNIVTQANGTAERRASEIMLKAQEQSCRPPHHCRRQGL